MLHKSPTTTNSLLHFRAAFAISPPLLTAMALCVFLWFPGCLTKEKCFQNADCEPPEICDADGDCDYQCENDSDCDAGFVCDDHECIPDSSGDDDPLSCPAGMVPIANAYCMDIYEASRPDATEFDPGSDSSKAISKAGVLPWRVDDNAEAMAACMADGKGLCSESEWSFACRGTGELAYAYGNSYDPVICNGIDTFGMGNQHLLPTGSFSECVNEYGVYDLNGNLWEHVLGGDGTKVRGGAYNCSNSTNLHRCDYIPQTWTPSALGFRCCLEYSQPDGNTGEDE